MLKIWQVIMEPFSTSNAEGDIVELLFTKNGGLDEFTKNGGLDE